MTSGEKSTTDAATRTGGTFSDAANRIRDSAKYILAAFAAVGALLAAGLQLTNLGGLATDRPDHRLQWGAAGVVAAVIGIAIAVGSATVVISRSFVTLHWLSRKIQAPYRLDDDAILLASFRGVRQLHTAYASALQEQKTTIERIGGDDPPDRNELAERRSLVLYYDNITKNVIEQASYRRLRRAYTWARLGMFFGAVLSALGITTFAWAANPPADSSVPTVVSVPTDVRLQLSEEGMQRIGPQLGAGCDLSEPLAAVAVADLGDNYQLAIVPSSTCTAALVTVAPADGSVVPATASPTDGTG